MFLIADAADATEQVESVKTYLEKYCKYNKNIFTINRFKIKHICILIFESIVVYFLFNVFEK